MTKRIWDKYTEIENRIKSLNYKLYKYYSIPNGVDSYSIKNLKKQLVFFSKPQIFNDPFDSNIGAIFQESYKPYNKTIREEKINSYRITKIIAIAINSKKTNDYIIFWKNFVEYFDYTDGTSVYYFDVLKYLYNLKSQNKIESLFTFFNIQDNNEYSLLKYLISDDAVTKYLNTIIDDNKSVNLTIDDYKNTISSMFRLVNKKDDLKEFDLINDVLCSERDFFHRAVNALFSVSCFSESPLNILMWSHYADKHRGFCVEYDLKNVFDEYGYDQLFCPVVYSKKRVSVLLNSKNRRKYKGYDINIVHAFDSLFIKSKIWSYEKEWRKIVLDDNDIVKFNNDIHISRVYLGANISDDNAKMIKEICREQKIPISQLFLDSSFYKLLEK